MNYNVIVTEEAENDLDRFIRYLLFEKQSVQAAENLINDFEESVQILSDVAGSLKLCENPRLNELGYKKFNFQRHRYFMLFRLEGTDVIVDAMFHELQDYENKII